MLKEILSNCSESELIHLAGINAAQEMQFMTGEVVTREQLVSAVAISVGIELAFSEKLRNMLIDRMSPSTAKLFVEQIVINSGYVGEFSSHIDYYQILIEISAADPLAFAEILGFNTAYFKASLQSSVPLGIEQIIPSYGLYDYQQSMVRKAEVQLFHSETPKCLLHLPTGAGKTRTAMNIAAQHLRNNPKALVVWLADTAELCDQARAEFREAWQALGNRQIQSYSYYADSTISLGGIDRGFLVASLQKLHSASNSVANAKALFGELKRYASLVIFDEAHKAIAPTYRKVTEHLLSGGNASLLGLSATPGRKLDAQSDEDKELAAFFGDNKVTMKIAGFNSPVSYLVENRYLARPFFKSIVYSGGQIHHSGKSLQKSSVAQINKELAANAQRNHEIMKVIEQEHHMGSAMIVFATDVTHARTLSALLSFKGIKSYSLDSEQDSLETRRFKIGEYSTGKVNVLINYGILTAGFDAPRTNVAIVARPTESLVQYSQMIGRAMRGEKSKGNRECRIYTVKDDIPAYRSVVRAFENWDQIWKEV